MFAPMATFAQKFGHVNSQEIIQAMPEFAKARTDIEALTKQYEADLKSMQEELQKKSEAYEKEQATLPANIKQRREQELQEMYQKIQQSYQDNQQAWPRSSLRRCRPSPLRSSRLSSRWASPATMSISWTSPAVFPISARRSLLTLPQK